MKDPGNRDGVILWEGDVDLKMPPFKTLQERLFSIFEPGNLSDP